MSTVSGVLSGGWLLLFTLSICFSLQAQSERKPKKPKPSAECEGNCFTTDVVRAEINEEGCTEYELKVSHNGTCRYDLSHYTVALPCGDIKKLSNSRNWKQVIGKDPTTGLWGFKIDDIPSFGKDSKTSFTVNVTVCSDSTCLEKLGVVAYKAGQCIDYDTLEYEVIGGGNGGGGDDDGDGDGDGGGNDSTQTCSTLSAMLKVLNAKCYGQSTGSLEVAIEDGKAPFLYRWSTGSTDSVLQNLTAGVYSVTVTDANGNTLTLSKEVAQPADILISESIFNPSCSGNANGSIDLSVSGGVGGYQYSWSNGATAKDLTSLSAGLYTVTVTDSSGCSKQKSIMLTNASRVSLSGSVTKTSCGQTNGAINLTVSGGMTPYTYVWNNGATTEDVQNLPAGSYKIMVTDAAGCTAQSTYVVSENNTVRVNFTVTPAGCFNEPIGAIDITPSGGTSPYTYTWQHGPTSEDLTGLVSGIYRVTVTDQSGCSVLTAINVPKKSIQVTTEIIQPLCSGDSTGSITVIPIDGGGTYSWSNGGTSNTIRDVPVGTYTVTITDASGCSRTLSYTLIQPAPLVPTTVVSNNQCGAEGSFSIDLTITGGKSPYTYLWSTGATTQDILGLHSGYYSVQITDVNGCTILKEVSIDPVTNGFECIINPFVGPLVCGSVGNALISSTTDADSYQWSITSSDNSWNITSGGSSSVVVFTVGTSGSTATFSLTLQKDGCTKTCSYSVATGCEIRDSNGGGDPSSGDPCTLPDTTTTIPVVKHFHRKKPTSPEERDWYFKISVYPNPFERDITFEWTATEDDRVRLEILDGMGRRLTDVYVGNVRKGEHYGFAWTGVGLKDRMYYYKYTSSKRSTYGKLFRK